MALLNIDRIQPGSSDSFEIEIARLPTHTAIELPIFVFRGKEKGPTLMLTAGLHGDEINGIEILRRMIFRKQLQPDHGTIIAIPVVNVFGFIHSSRRLPEGKDLNRSFPGSTKGSLSSRVANVLMTRILPLCEGIVDLHTGGGSKYNIPQIRCNFADPASMALARAFGAIALVHSRPPDGSFRKEVGKKGVACITFEGGESMRLDQDAIEAGISGVRRILVSKGLCDGPLTPAPETPEYAQTTWIRAPHTGIASLHVKPGEVVKRAQKLGTIADPFGEREIPIRSRAAGLVIGINYRCVVHRGEALFNLGIRTAENQDLSP